MGGLILVIGEFINADCKSARSSPVQSTLPLPRCYLLVVVVELPNEVGMRGRDGELDNPKLFRIPENERRCLGGAEVVGGLEECVAMEDGAAAAAST